VGSAGKNLVEQVRDFGSLKHAGVGQIKAIQTGGFLLGLGAQLAGHRHHSVIRGPEGRAVPVEGKQQMMRHGPWQGPPSLHDVGVLIEEVPQIATVRRHVVPGAHHRWGVPDTEFGRLVTASGGGKRHEERYLTMLRGLQVAQDETPRDEAPHTVGHNDHALHAVLQPQFVHDLAEILGTEAEARA
jgi:hypothetical protein